MSRWPVWLPKEGRADVGAAAESNLEPGTSRPVSDAALLEGLRSVLCSDAEDRELEIVARSVNPSASSCPSEFVTVRTSDDVLARLFCKFDASPEVAVGVHRRGLRYEELVNRQILAHLGGSTPRFVGSFRVRACELLCLVTEAIPAAARVSRWGAARLPEAAAWIGRFHARSQALLARETPAFLARYDENHFARWTHEVHNVADDLGLAPPWLSDVLAGYERSIALLRRESPVIVHGEYYPSNVLASLAGVHPIDWESAGIGPGVIDIASLTMGWPAADTARAIRAYVDSRWRGAAPEHFDASLMLARFYLCLRMLGDRPKQTEKGGGPSFFDYIRATAIACGYLEERDRD